MKLTEDLPETMEKIKEMFMKDLEELKNKQTEEQYTRRNQWQNMWSRRTDKWPGRSNSGNQCFKTEYRKENGKKKKEEDSLRDLWDSIKCINYCIIGLPGGEEREKGHEKILEELIAENFPNMGKEIVNQVQEAESPRKDKPKEKQT